MSAVVSLSKSDCLALVFIWYAFTEKHWRIISQRSFKIHIYCRVSRFVRFNTSSYTFERLRLWKNRSMLLVPALLPIPSPALQKRFLFMLSKCRASWHLDSLTGSFLQHPYFISNLEKIFKRYHNALSICVVNKLTIWNKFFLQSL